MKKSDLKNGAVVQSRNGDKYLKVDNTLLSLDDFGYYMGLDTYTNDLRFILNASFDIVKVNNNIKNSNEYKNNALVEVFEKDKWTWIRYEKPKIKPSKEEYYILKALPDKYKDGYIARNSDNNMYFYKNKPYKTNILWGINGGKCYSFKIFNHLFQFIKWKDEESYSIKELLNYAEVE